MKINFKELLDNYDKTYIFDLKTGMILACSEGKEIGINVYEDGYKYDDFNHDVLENDFKNGSLSIHLDIHEGEDHIDFDI